MCRVAVRSSLILALLGAPGAAVAAPEADVFGSEQALTPALLTDAVLKRHPTLRALEAESQAAEARVVPAQSLDDPRVALNVAPQTFNEDLRIGTVLPGIDVAQQLQITQMLPWPGKLALRGSMARFEARASREEIARMSLMLATSAAEAAADWYYAHAALRVNDHHRNLWREFQRIAEAKYAAGRASKQDALQAQTEELRLERRELELRRIRAETRAAINALLNRESDEQIPPPAAMAEPREPPPADNLHGHALAARPEISALGYRRDAANESIALAEKNFYPDFMLMGMYDGVWDMPQRRGLIGISINIPLPERRHAAVDEARAKQIRLSHEIEAIRTRVLAEIRQAWERVRESVEAWRLYDQRLVPVAQEALAAAQADYQAGRSDLLPLITAERSLAQSELEREQALADYHRRLARLAAAAGRTATADLSAIPARKSP